MRFDPDLGWTSVPDTRLENFYGPGRHLTINSQGVRAKRAYTDKPPAGKPRALCAGDAFTLGPGVDDDATWCAQLEQIEPRLETMNLGQGGYGLDQSFLRVRRDGVGFDFDVLLFAFVRDDFSRMEKDNYHHYGKPLLRIGATASSRCATCRSPTAAGGSRGWCATCRCSSACASSSWRGPRSARCARRPRPGSPRESSPTCPARCSRSWLSFSDQHGATLVLIDLPTFADYEIPNELWRERIAREARKRDLPFIDLVEECAGCRAATSRGSTKPSTGRSARQRGRVQRGGPRVGG